MPFVEILNEADELNCVSARLAGLAELHPLVSEALMVISGNIRNTATLLAVLVEIKGLQLN